MHILVCDRRCRLQREGRREYAVRLTLKRTEIPVQATVCSDPEQVLAIPDLELYRIAFLDVDMPQVNGIALGGQLRHRNPDIVWSMYRPIWPLRWMATRSTPTATSSNGTSPSSCPAVWRTSMRP